ncbi:MAG: ABC-2 type transport system ATP-binding protein [Flavobacteriales bacterium]|jgi:ABC-2 type transport system ATP-binding protein
MISINGMTISYDGKTNVIDGLNLTLVENQIHGIVGLNGAGKTSMLRAIFGLVKADSGLCNFHDETLSKKHIAFLPTENYFFPNITGNEYLALFKNQDFDLKGWNDLFQLPLDRIIDDYSTGMKKKLALIGILKMDKPVLILDEPFNGLDIETGRILRSILLKLKQKGKTIIVTSHIIETLTNMCDQIHYLESGIIQFSKNEDEFGSFETELFEKLEEQNRDAIEGLIS